MILPLVNHHWVVKPPPSQMTPPLMMPRHLPALPQHLWPKLSKSLVTRIVQVTCGPNVCVGMVGVLCVVVVEVSVLVVAPLKLEHVEVRYHVCHILLCSVVSLYYRSRIVLLIRTWGRIGRYTICWVYHLSARPCVRYTSVGYTVC